ncbi:MAG TPA: sulfite exporter TauE/SafE family protein [Patescibacteria group bacterium]
MLEHFSIFVIGLLAGFFDSVVGAGGLISTPALLLLGLSPQTAIATDRFGSLGQSIAAFFSFNKAKKINWNYVWIFSLLSLAGSLIGARILLHVDTDILQRIVAILILALLPLIIFGKKKETTMPKPTARRVALGLFSYFVIMTFGGFFGQGTGPLMFYALSYFLGFTLVEILATGIIPWLVLSASSTFVFAINGIIDYQKGLVLFVGMAVGGYLGAHLAVTKGDGWLKRLFIIFVVVASIKLLFF